MNKIKGRINLKSFLPLFALIFTLLLDILIPESSSQPESKYTYFRFFLLVLTGFYFVILAVSLFIKALHKVLAHNGPFYFAFVILLGIINLLTGKFAVLPVLLFPSLNNVFSVFIESANVLGKCVLYSFRLLILGVIFGGVIGFITGVLIGFSKKFFYWINPFVKIIGPIPATAWIPIVLTAFPTTFQASVFLVALSVWFPVAMLTCAGIQNVNKTLFEVGRTLGAGRRTQILRIAIPASLPNIFQGLFYGVCSAFISLMTAEMFGAKYGLGWFISWQKSMMLYKGVYAGLILIAIFCSIILSVLTGVRKKLLAWQSEQVL